MRPTATARCLRQYTGKILATIEVIPVKTLLAGGTLRHVLYLGILDAVNTSRNQYEGSARLKKPCDSLIRLLLITLLCAVTVTQIHCSTGIAPTFPLTKGLG